MFKDLFTDDRVGGFGLLSLFIVMVIISDLVVGGKLTHLTVLYIILLLEFICFCIFKIYTDYDMLTDGLLFIFFITEAAEIYIMNI